MVMIMTLVLPHTKKRNPEGFPLTTISNCPLFLSDYAWKGYRGVIDTLKFDVNGRLLISGSGICIGNYAHYIARPTGENDLPDEGAFILMCVEMCYVPTRA